jgi:SOS-response transcriptional repressor LexA
MPTGHSAELASIRTFPQLVRFLRDEMNWPIETDNFEELTFDYTPEELGIEAKSAAKIQEIKRLRPLSPNQPWGIFFVKFEPKRLPVVALRRILSRVVLKKRASANKAERQAWAADDLLFISNYGEGDERRITFAHFSQDEAKGDLPTLKVLGWDNLDTPLHLDDVADKLTHDLAWPSDEHNTEQWLSSWHAAFTIRHREVIETSRDLSIHLAELARAIRDRIRTALAIETERGPLTKLMKAFQEALVHDLDADGFADMYAQTIAYGLLSARIANAKATTVDHLPAQIPVTNPFLKELMQTFLHAGGRRGKAGGPGIDFDELGVNEVVELLNDPDTHIEAIVRDFGDKNPHEDPVIRFYEGFLSEYDHALKVRRGVFYTPRPVVSYIVRSVDKLLRTEFDLADGLADTTTWGEMRARNLDLKLPACKRYVGGQSEPEIVAIPADTPFVQVLDPACGTGTFLVEVIDLIHHTMLEKWKAQGHDAKKIEALWNEYVPTHLLPRLHGYELLMAPYAIAHLKIGLKLHDTDYRFGSDERARIYLTNALEPASDIGQLTLAAMLPALAHEAEAVNGIKRDQRFTVVIGNPPYSKMSGNLGPDAVALVEPFRFVSGERIVEKGALALELNLQDDYVKFWGLLCSQVLASGAGVGSYISNSRYLASPTLRGMRAHLCEHFSQGFFLDLGGQVSERKSVGTVDENVFEIEQGVSVGAVVANPARGHLDAVRHGRLMGTRDEKYRVLMGSSAIELGLTIPVAPPMYRFTRGLNTADEEFDSWHRLEVLMPFNSGSVITSRDNLAIDLDREALLEKIGRFASSRRGDRSLEGELGYSAKSKWDVERCKEQIRALAPKERTRCARTILYRPFDRRFIFYLPALLDTPSKPVCESIFDHENLVLLTPAVKTSGDFTHVLVSREPSEKKACSHDRATQMFPLYSYGGRLLASRASNLSKAINPGADERDSFSCIYAILHSPTYRSRYGSALRDAFPRVPSVANGDLFKQLVRCGGELVALHLMESPKLDNFITTYAGPKNPEVGRIGWSNGTVWLDAAATKKGQLATPGTIAFRGVPEAVWNFHIGGYQVCEKWLKDRKGRTLLKDDIAHYQKIVVALAETIRVMKEIDEVIEQHGGWPGAFQTGEAKAAAPKVVPFRPRIVQPAPKDRYVTCVPLVPLKAAAGAFSDPQHVEDDSFEWVEIKTSHSLRPGMFVAQVVGKSMEPDIPDGAYCLFAAPVEGSRQGKTVLVQLREATDPETGERYTVKRYESEKTQTSDSWLHAKITLKPLNPEYDPIVLTDADEEELQVIAELVAVLGSEA